MTTKLFILGEGDLFHWSIQNAKVNKKLIHLLGSFDSSKKNFDNFYLNNRKIFQNVDCIFLCGHRYKISEKILDENTVINSHGSLLPKYKGFHGNVWAMINCEKKIGFTIHLVDKNFDSGPIIFKYSINTGDILSYLELKEKYMKYWKLNIFKIISKFNNQKLKPKIQNQSQSTFVTKRNKSDCKINWDQPTLKIKFFIRALKYPFTNGAYFTYKKKKFYVYDTFNYKCLDYSEIPGKLVYFTEEGILIKTQDNVIGIKSLIKDGKIYSPINIFNKIGLRIN